MEVSSLKSKDAMEVSSLKSKEKSEMKVPRELTPINDYLVPRALPHRSRRLNRVMLIGRVPCFCIVQHLSYPPFSLSLSLTPSSAFSYL